MSLCTQCSDGDEHTMVVIIVFCINPSTSGILIEAWYCGKRLDSEMGQRDQRLAQSDCACAHLCPPRTLSLCLSEGAASCHPVFKCLLDVIIFKSTFHS